MVTLGIDALLADRPPWGDGDRLGLLCNHASVNQKLTHTATLFQQCYGKALTCLFSPQHGFHAEKQDNMIESAHSADKTTGLPVFSLYGDSRRPSREMLDHIDVLVIDIQDVGTRVYTFMYTMAYCLEAAMAFNKRVVVLDRPNPIGGSLVEGNILKPDHASFVGLFPLPMRHGLTFGELARYIAAQGDLNVDLQVVKMNGWQRSMNFRDTGLPWVFPSPNMPTVETAVVYPGQVIWEGTEVSEGRGTTLPFELTGAPYWEHEPIMAELERCDLAGCYFRPLLFEPTSGKCAGQTCTGFQLHVTDLQRFRPYYTSLYLLQVVMLLYPDEFAYKQPPYEYEFDQLPMDLILGDREVREGLEAGIEVRELEQGWLPELAEFDELRRNYFLYEEHQTGA